MGLLEAVRKAFRRTGMTEGSLQVQHNEGRENTPSERARVPEVTPAELMAEMGNQGGHSPLLLDIREPFERVHTLIPESIHIPMNSLPARLVELDPGQEIVVYCAHGNRSYGVTGWLIQQGYTARSLKGGIVDWEHQNGPVARGYNGRS